MSDPGMNLLILVGIALVAAALFWPRVGLLQHLRAARGAIRRIRVEDALKHIYHLEERNLPSTLESIGGALEISSSSAVELSQWMERNGLVYSLEGRFFLTEEGRRYALQVIRAHRLWERYLADETGADEKTWHAKAHRREHELTPEETNALAARLGNPRFDPHGDPIPTADGVVPERREITLAEIDSGAHARVVHVEDEPDAVYQQLLALGIHLGMEIHVRSKLRERIFVEADGREFVLAPMVAANVSVEPLTEREISGEQEPLSSLQIGEVAEVVRLSPACRGLERRRLMDLGVIPGTEIIPERRSPGGGLTAYRVRGTVIALRDDQARMIRVARRRKAVS